jgi:hypothetical protein
MGVVNPGRKASCPRIMKSAVSDLGVVLIIFVFITVLVVCVGSFVAVHD